ncbi:unnamed protein product [Cyclocybe aegerita]|uniref:Uncharacterized protein n=1 Tax=Cyclocybe aegerita TaxID=1973307 RepID=A0A8S0WQD8_CYCAE|nr:unnamed protein product [Cyclocybe aegerita]
MSPLENQDPNTRPTDDAAASFSEGDTNDDAARYKRLYLNEKRRNDQAKSKNATMTLQRCGRIIPKMVSLFANMADINYQAEQHQLYVAGKLDADDLEANDEAELEHIKKQNARSNATFLQLVYFVPNLEKELEDGDIDRAEEIFSQLQTGSLAARSDDISKMRIAVAEWLNKAYPQERALDPRTREGRRIEHNVTGWLLCPIKYDWKDESVRRKLRAQEEGFNFTANFCIYALYKKHRGTMTTPDKGFLKSALLVKVIKQFVTSPESAQALDLEALDSDSTDDENVQPTLKMRRTEGGRKKKTNNKSVSGIHNVSKVTPRLIAYSATMLLLSLSSAPEWRVKHAGLNFERFYYCIVDFFEAPPNEVKKKQRHELLKWWNQQIFPLSFTAESSNAADDTMALLNG